MRIKTIITLLIINLFAQSQVNMEGFVKNRAGEVKDKAKEKARQKATETLEKQRKEFDESNFNYAISFLDNSGTFESSEKGNALSNTLINTTKLVNNEEKTVEERAYTNLRNGELFMASNKYHLAEQSLKLAKFLYETDGKTNTLNYAQAISDLSLLYQSRGRFNKAKPLGEQAIALRKNLNNKGMLLVSENNLAVLKKETGLYLEAEQDFQQIVKEADLLKDKLASALAHNNLAMTYLDMNKLKEAENQMHTCLSEASLVLKDNSANFIKLQINLANIYRFQKKYQNAEEIYLRAIKVKEKKLGAHPDLAHLKKGLAQVYLEMGKTEEVEKLLLSAYDINKRKLGESNPATVATQQELANYYRYTNNIVKATELINKVVENKKAIYGIQHPNYVQALEDRAIIYWAGGKTNESHSDYKKVIGHTLDYISGFFKSLNENEKNVYWERTNVRLQRYYSFLFANYKDNKELTEEFYNTVINTKGFLLNNSSKIRSSIFNSADAELKEIYQQWLETKENLNQAYQLSQEELSQEKINLDSLNQRAGFLERELSKKSSLFKETVSEGRLAYESLQQPLATNEAIVEIVELSEYKNGFTGGEKYIALVLTRQELKIVEMGDGATIKEAIAQCRKKIIDELPENEAYAVVWKSLDMQLKGISKVYASLDGAYHQLSIFSLKDDGGWYLIDKYAIQYLGNSADILEVKKNEGATLKPTTAILFGNPAYGKNELIEQLPGTEKEVKSITKMLTLQKMKPVALYGDKATETKVKEVNSPSILHFATHGYFLPDLSQMETTKVLGVDIAAAKENPLLRSGLLFANCENVFDESYHTAGHDDNGVLTAYEAMNLNLDKTDLVVLSACETGLGSVKQGEGVYGLQRAFLIAGAKSIIMSLWSVNDDATMHLMTLFYTSYLKTGNKNLAFTEAIKKLKIKYKEPYYWGAFVMLSR